MFLKMMEKFHPKLRRPREKIYDLPSSPSSPAPPPTPYDSEDEFKDPEDSFIDDEDDHDDDDGDTDYNSCVDALSEAEATIAAFNLPADDQKSQKSSSSGRKYFLAGFLKAKIIPRSVEKDDVAGGGHLDIGRPTDVRHVTHVTVDPTFSFFHREYKAFWSLPPPNEAV